VSLIHGVTAAERCVFQIAALYPVRPTGEEKRWDAGHVLRAFREDGRLFKQIPEHQFWGKSIARLLYEMDILHAYGILPI